MARQIARMQRYTRPGDALHVGHGCRAINVRAMPFLLADHTEDAERRWMTLNAGRYRRPCDQCPIFVKRDTLIRDRDDDLERTLRSVFRLTLPLWLVLTFRPELAITPPKAGLGPKQGLGMRRRPC